MGGILIATLVVVLVVLVPRGDATGADGPAPAGPPTARADGLPAETRLGETELRVRQLPAMVAYYRDVVGLEVLEETDSSVLLGHETPVLRLTTTTDGAADPRDAGLYHSAFLYADEPTLAEALLRVAEQAPELYQGSADHRVSLAFYLADPEGNGVELYVDRPREEWEWIDGKVTMGSLALDPNAFIEEHLGGTASGAATIGHMHLKVGDLAGARAFYEGVLGFDVVAEADGALFYSAGGYHHHVATNTWQSAGAPARSTTIGLGSITIEVPDAAAVAAASERLDAAGVDYESIDGGISTSDPWGNGVRLVAAVVA